MVEIIPAIMPKSFDDLNEKYSRVKDFAQIVQIDVMDGKFTQSVSWPYNKVQTKSVSSCSASQVFEKSQGTIAPLCEYFAPQDKFSKSPRTPSLRSAGLLKTYLALRNQTFKNLSCGAVLPLLNFDFEIDLMVLNPETEIERWIKAGAKRVIIHIESVNKIEDVFLKIPNSVEVGVALNTTTTNEKIYQLAEKIDFVQFMGIEKIGFQGQKFDAKIIEKIIDLRNRFPKIIISVDGGVNLDTAMSLIKAGANRLVSGSAIFESGNIEDMIKKLKNLSL